jgi:hypothetical protein
MTPSNDLPCVNWQPVSTPPDAETTVLLYMPKADEPIWLGYLDFDEEKPLWRDVSSVGLRGRFAPTHWAHLPEPPACDEPLNLAVTPEPPKK